MSRFINRLIMTAVILPVLSIPAFASAADILAERTLPRGTIVTASDLSNAPEAVDLIGLETIRTVRVGARVEARHLQAPRLVRRNEVVTVVYRAGRLRMETKGRSLGEGGQGDMITVMNTNSRQRVSGRITAAGEVEVTK